jgi:hypothetical protein
MYLCPEFEKSGSCPKGKYCPYPHKSVVKKKERTRKRAASAGETRTTAGAPAAARSDKRKRYYEMGGTVSMESGSELRSVQVSDEVGSGDLNAETSELFRQDDDREKASQNNQCSLDGQIDASSDLVPENEEPEVKYPKLGILPGYIPLG